MDAARVIEFLGFAVPIAWLLGQPWMEERQKRRAAQRKAERNRELRMWEAAARYGSREGLERVLAGDLRKLMARRALDDAMRTGGGLDQAVATLSLLDSRP